MLIAKFALLAFLMALATMMVQLQDRPAPVGGPFYYADPEGHPNPVQPKFKLNFKQMMRSHRNCEVLFDERSLPLLVRHMVDRKEQWRMNFFWARDTRLLKRIWSKDGHIFRVDNPPWR